MEASGGVRYKGSRPLKPSKFSVYQNPAFSAALKSKSIEPSESTLLCIFFLFLTNAFALLVVLSRENGFISSSKLKSFSPQTAYLFGQVIQTIMSLVFVVFVFVLFKSISWHRTRQMWTQESQACLTKRQLQLLGVKPPVTFTFDNSKKPPYSKPSSTRSPSDVLVPLHPTMTIFNWSSHNNADKSNSTGGNKLRSISGASKYLVPGYEQNSRGSVVSTPWSCKRVSPRAINSEEKLQHFLAEVDEKITESAAKLATPCPTIRGLGVASPVRMTSGSQKFTTPPKKLESELPQIDQCRDRLRQWFSSVLLNPLISKIETSHIQVMQSAAKLGTSITISKIGIDKECQIAFLDLDEDLLLHQLRAAVLQAIDASTPKLPQANMQPSPTSNPMVPIMQECVDAISEHQKLRALMKGEWVKGLLPQSSFRAEYYTVQRIRELAEGTCVKHYEYPSDSHLLLYLFCAFLEHPKWRLHDTTSYARTLSSINPLFLADLPLMERFPEKYISVISGIPSALHPGACTLVVGKESPPIFALHWDRKLQFSLQGRTALWDSILLLCQRIKVGYGGIIRGMHLGSSALRILPVLDLETEAWRYL
ncbi:hypothetical protein UlMin_012700 [Ulmus minor]